MTRALKDLPAARKASAEAQAKVKAENLKADVLNRLNAGESVMVTCRCCSCSFEVARWQVLKGDYECTPCRRARQISYRQKRKEIGKPVVSGRASKEYHRAYSKKYFQIQENKERRARLQRGYAKAHGTASHHKARGKVRTEIKSGRMKRQPCEVCGAERVDAHHDDYSKPLEVRWLCRTHHVEHHARQTEAQGAPHE